MKLDLLNNEKGSITVYVLVAMLFILAIVFGRFLLANRQLQTQVTAIKQVKTIYESNVKEYDDENSSSIITSPTTSPIVSPSPSSGGNTQNEGIDIEIGTNPIPIYNYSCLKYFLDGGAGPYYIYQEGKNYIGGASATYKLCFDITIPETLAQIVSTSGYNTRSFTNKYNMLNNVDFNNHCIYTSNGNMIFRNNGTIVVK